MKKTTSIHEIGVGLRPAHYDHFMDGHPSSVSWVEVISENFLNWKTRETPAARNKLLKIREHLPVSLHGVSLSLGSADQVNPDYLKALAQLIDVIQPVSVSDHLCWTGLNNTNTHDLLPLPYTEEAINHVVQKISLVQDKLKRVIAVENLSSYVEFNSSEMPEWEFLNAVAVRSGCKLILDVNNVYVSSVNHHFNPMTYLAAMKPELVEHLHLAGHTIKDGYLIDTHDKDISPEVFDLYRWCTKNIPGPKVMIERDGNIPSWEDMETELAKVKAIQEEA